MSDPQADNAQTVKGLILVVVAAIVGIPLFIYLAVKLFSGGMPVDPSSPGMTKTAISARLMPVGASHLDESGPPGSRSGKVVYASVCINCHGSGLVGSPKFGDTAAWAPRISEGFSTLIDHALHGFKAMPARGGAADLTDDEVARAIAYMADAAGATFTPPPVKAAGVAAASASSAEAPAAAPAMSVASDATAAPDPAVKGKEIYGSVCIACHSTGVAGAPKFGDKAAWAPRLKGGMDAAIKIAMKGLNAMPPKGGYTGSDAEFRAAAEYMIDASK